MLSSPPQSPHTPPPLPSPCALVDCRTSVFVDRLACIMGFQPTRPPFGTPLPARYRLHSTYET